MKDELILTHLYKSFKAKNKAKIEVLRDISLRILPNEFVSIIGPSGCGKSTLLDCICGLSPIDAGDIFLNVESIASLQGRVSLMMQDSVLFPWRSVLQNVTLPMEIKGENRKKREREALNYLKDFGLKQFSTYYPYALSGGMRQRVSLLRTYLCNKDVMLLDEPFGSLDAISRSEMQEWFLHVWQKHKKTVVFVTHDIEEAIFLSDTIIVLSKRPARVIAKIPVVFKRPRKRDMYTHANFVELKKRIFKLLL